MSYLGFVQYAYHTSKPLLPEQRLELENRIKILEPLVEHEQGYKTMKLIAGTPMIGNGYNDLSRVLYYNYLVVVADLKEKKERGK